MKNVDNYNPQFSAPILLVLFNRPQYFHQTAASINKSNPSKLYIHIDGPRDGDDIKKINEIKGLLDEVNPSIDKEILIQEDNLGCRAGMVSAIDWFFENEDFGIILEDDCIPHESFYEYCSKLLIEFKNEKDIFMISGDNGGEIVPSKFFKNNDIMSVPIPLIWGWATWKDRWEEYERNKPNLNLMSLYKNLRDFKSFERFFLINYFLKLKNYESLNTWDIHLFYTLVLKRKSCIIPSFNLIKNIGFNEEATHTKETTFRSSAETHKIKIKQKTYTDSFKKLNSKIIYLLQSNLDSKTVHNRSLLYIRAVYLKGRLRYLIRSVWSKLKKTIRA